MFFFPSASEVITYTSPVRIIHWQTASSSQNRTSMKLTRTASCVCKRIAEFFFNSSFTNDISYTVDSVYNDTSWEDLHRLPGYIHCPLRLTMENNFSLLSTYTHNCDIDSCHSSLVNAHSILWIYIYRSAFKNINLCACSKFSLLLGNLNNN